MWESDATARAAVAQSVASSTEDIGAASLLSGVEASIEAVTLGPRSAYGVAAGGAYARAFHVSVEGGGSAPEESVSGELATYGEWALSPHIDLSLDGAGYLATELGVRAGDALAARDPFLSGGRLQYTVGGGPGFSTVLSRRSSLHVSGGYELAGALDADDAEAIGVDAHAARAGIAYRREIGARDALRPELNYEYAHLYHALLDVDLRRGPADVHAASAVLVESHTFSRRLSGRVGGGVTVASPPPILASADLTVAPGARARLAYVGQRYQISAAYAYEYTSLGPRIGFGQEHTARAEVSFWPARGGQHRDLLLTGTGRFSVGSAPVAADPPIHEDPGAPRASLEGSVTTYTALAGVALEVPFTRGLLLLGGFDLEYLHATRDPTPPGERGGGALRTIWTIGLAGTLSTDRGATVRLDPDADPEERLDPTPTAAPTRPGAPHEADGGTSTLGRDHADPGRP